MKPSMLPIIAIALVSFDSVAGQRTREQARQLTSNLVVSSVEALEQFGATPSYPVANINALKSEIESCGITYNGTACLDSGFENFGNAGVKDVDTTDRSGYVFFSRFKKKGDPRILLMAVIANKSDCVLSKTDRTKCEIDPATRAPRPLKAFRTGNIWAITPGREKPETYVADFLKCTETEEECMLRPLLAYDPISATKEEAALADLEGTSRFATNFRRFYQATQVAGEMTNRQQLDRAVRALEKNSEVITRSGNATYRSAFFNLIRTKFSRFPNLVSDVAREIGGLASAGSLEQLQATLISVQNGERSAASMAVLANGFANTRLAVETRREALALFARLATTTPDKDKVILMLASAEQPMRSTAYSVVGEMSLTDENLPALNRVLENAAVNVRGNGVKALSRLNTIKGMERMAMMIKDKSVDVALAAAEYLKDSLSNTTAITEANFIFMMENSTIAATAVTTRDRRVLEESLIPARSAALKLAFERIRAREHVVLAALKTSASHRLVSVRVDAISFIGRLGSADATVALINLLTDSNVLVNAELMKALNARLISDDHVDLLFRMSINPSVMVRQSAVALIGKVQSRKAQQALIQKAQENIDSSSWKVRRDVALILGGYYTAEVTNTLIAMMNEARPEVRDAAFSQLSKGDRLFDDTQVLKLKNLLQSTHPVVPSRAVILLAQVNTIASMSVVSGLTDPTLSNSLQLEVVNGLGAVDSTDTTTLLISFLVDDDMAVRSTAEAALNTRVLTDSQLSLLAPAIANPEVSIRLIGIKQLGRGSSTVAMDMLSALAATEVDETLKLEIQAALEALKARQAVVVGN